MNLLERTIAAVKPLDGRAIDEARQHWDGLAKPIGSLGRMEELVVQLAGIYGEVPEKLGRRGIVVFAADNGVVAERVTTAPKEVTAIQSASIANGWATVNAFCRMMDVELKLVDIGIDSSQAIAGAENRRIANGTGNITQGPAMSGAECMRAIEIGIEYAADMAEQGYRVLMGGEMGIGNTTSSSCLAALMTEAELDRVVGKGSGLTDEGLLHKKDVVRRALAANPLERKEPLVMLSAVGGFDIAGLTGFFLGAAAQGLPAIVDGFIAATAALLACRLAPGVKDYLIASHISAEPGYGVVIEALGIRPHLDMQMRLGEGTGAILMLPLLDAALAAYHGTATLLGTEINPDDLIDIRKQG